MNNKQWNPGKADEVWKILICANDVNRTEDVIQFLLYVLTDAGNDLVKGVEQIKQMSGKDIIQGLNAYKESAYKSVEEGLKKK